MIKKVAGIVQLVEHLLAKEDVARSSRVTRLNTLQYKKRRFIFSEQGAFFKKIFLYIIYDTIS